MEERRFLSAAISARLGRDSPHGSRSSNFGVWAVEEDAGERVCSLSFALPVAVGVGEPGRGPTHPRPRLHSVRGAQVAPRAVACCKAKETQRSAALVPRTKKNKFYKSFPHLLPTPTPQIMLQIKVSWNILFKT